MPVSTAAAVRKLIAQRKPESVYLIIGDDDVEVSRLAGDIAALVDDTLRVFNAERLYAGERGVTPAAIVEAARVLPMMGDRRVVTVLRAERILKPKRRGKAAVEAEAVEDAGEPSGELDVLDAYIRDPVPETTLVFAAADVDRTRKIYKTLHKHATIVECWGLKPGREARVDLRDVTRAAEQLVRQAVGEAGQQIAPPAARLLAQRAGTEISRLRADVDRVLLYTLGKAKIELDDVAQVVSAEAAQDDWAVTNAIQRRDTSEALRQLALALDAGGVPYAILGQLAWFVREKMPYTDPRRVPGAIESLFRTDLDLKTSGGDARVLLERLVMELCGKAAAGPLLSR